MALPNLLIVGSQKCGTTWLHECLSKSKHVFGSRPKELNYFNRNNYKRWQADYEKFFDGSISEKWRLESTPHYYQLPSDNLDISQRIRDLLGEEVRLLVMLRDPVDRYLSCFTHHMIKGRTPYVETIDEFTDQFNLLSLGKYASISKHWRSRFPNIGIFFYDDLKQRRDGLVSDVMRFLGTEKDITPEQSNFLTNDKEKTVKRSDFSKDWPTMPRLSERLTQQLAEFYKSEVEELQDMTGRNLSAWKSLS